MWKKACEENRWTLGLRNEVCYIATYSLTHSLTHSLTYLLSYSMEQSPSWKETGFQLVEKFPTFYGTRRFITAFTNARHLSLSWASSIQSTPPHPTSWKSILTLSSHLRLRLPSGLFPSGFRTKTLYTPRLSSLPYALHAPPISFLRSYLL